MTDFKRTSDKNLPMLTLNNGISCDTDLDANEDRASEGEESPGSELDDLEEERRAPNYLPIPEERFDCCSYYNNAGFFSKIFFFWPYPIMKKGRLSLDILGAIPEDESAELQTKLLKQHWDARRDHSKGHALFKTVIKRFKWKIFQLFFLNLLAAACDAALPLMLKEIMSFIQDEEDSNDELWRALIFVALMVFTIFFSRILKENLAFTQLKIGIQANQALAGMVYSKILKVSPATNKSFKKGDIISLIQVDSPKIMFLFDTLPEVSRIPFLMVFFIITLYILIGVTFAAAMGIIVVFCLINYLLAKWSGKVQAERMKKMDKKTNVISEMIDNIKLIKFNSWIDMFLKKASKKRAKEIKAILKKNLLWVLNITFMNMNYPILTISVFLIAIFGVKMAIAVPTALAILNIINSMHSSARTLPLFIGDFIDFLVSMKRLQTFLNCNEIETQAICKDDQCYDQYSVKIENASFYWGFNEKIKKKKCQIAELEKAKILDKTTKVHDGEKYAKLQTGINEETKSTDSDKSVSSDNSDDESEEDSEGDDKVSLEEKITIRNIGLKVKKGEFIAVIGEIGAGKTSLISSIIGDMLAVDSSTLEEFKNCHIFDTRMEEDALNREKLIALNHQIYERFNYYRKKNLTAPKIKVRGSVSLMEQTPWVLNATIRDNILFGEALDVERYNKTIELCQLGRDLEILDGGDLTEIGEKGINLSGGQKARIGIARAVYANKDIVLMDDPLSALDAHVKKNIFDEVCLGALCGKTRILVTHAVDFLDRVDRILVVDKGEVIHNGSFEELKEEEYFRTILEHMRKEDHDDEEDEKEDTRKTEHDALLKKCKRPAKKNYMSVSGSTITADENKEKNKVTWRTYFKYATFTKMTTLTMVLTMAVLIGQRASDMLFDYYMLHWIKEIADGGDRDSWDIFEKVIIASVAVTAVSMLSGFIHIVFVFSTTIKLFKDMIHRVMHAPVNTYFDVTPSGVILNRFSKDFQIIETLLPLQIRAQMINYIVVISGVAIAAYNVIWVLACIPFIIAACYYIMRMFSKALKETSRIESISNSPILTHISETISGASTVRAYEKQAQFEDKQHFLQDRNVATQLLRRGVRGWFGTRVSLVVTLFIAFSFTYCVMAKNVMDPVLIGLMMVYMLEIQNNLISLFRRMVVIDARMVTFDRCLNLCKIPQEEAQRLPVPKDQCGCDWITHGEIKFVNYCAKYRPDTELVLKNLNLKIKAGSKIGVVGRTGAGKSTLGLAICRFLETIDGKILIDGVDISTVGLADLRDQITVIPQDPELFENILRFNLDPDKRCSDSEILALLDKAGLTNLVNRDPLGLDAKIHVRGDNLSSGEKQLICICRAILRKKKIVIMDEATANIDIHTEKSSQELIRTEFKNCTVITIAHRLNTIINSKKILVMSYGKIAEFDKPKRLMQDPMSQFYSLMQEFNS